PHDCQPIASRSRAYRRHPVCRPGVPFGGEGCRRAGRAGRTCGASNRPGAAPRMCRARKLVAGRRNGRRHTHGSVLGVGRDVRRPPGGRCRGACADVPVLRWCPTGEHEGRRAPGLSGRTDRLRLQPVCSDTGPCERLRPAWWLQERCKSACLRWAYQLQERWSDMTTELTPAETATATRGEAAGQAYVLEGTLLEACNCNVLCPCWIGVDPDNGTCDSVIAYHIDRGQISGVDVSGLTLLEAHHIPGNVL